MLTYFKVNGTIPLRHGDFGLAVRDLEDEIALEVCEIRVDDVNGLPVLVVYSAGDCSYGTACRIEDELQAFARSYALTGAVLETESEDGEGYILVGPTTLAMCEAELEWRLERVRAEKALAGEVFERLNELKRRAENGDAA